MDAAPFWIWFAENEHALLAGPVRKLIESLHERIVAIDARLGVEGCVDSPVRELIIKANGNSAAFPAARELVKAATDLDGWQVFALKPPQGFDFRTAHDGITIAAESLSFEPLTSAKRPRALAIRVFVPAEFSELEQTNYIVQVIVETGLGEELTSRIDYLDVAPLPNNVKSPLRITDLAVFIEWHARKYGDDQP